jgi:uncharacterized glyoxalase superfamily protein PhnB
MIGGLPRAEYVAQALIDTRTTPENAMPAATPHHKNIWPSLTVSDLAKSVKFYTEGLGFTVVDKNEVDGVMRFAMLAAGGAKVGLGQDDFAKGRDRKKGVGLRLWIDTEQDLAPLAAQAKAAGIVLDQELATLPWGPMAFAVTDPDGFQLTIVNSR